MAAKKEKLPLTVAPPEIRQGLKKIGERHGDKIGDEFKPKTPPDFKPKTKSKKQNKKEEKKRAFANKQRTLDKRKRQLRENATEHELFFLYNLKRLKIKNTFQKGVIDKDHFMIPDFYIPSLNMVVELDGEYHNRSKQQYRDYYKDKHYEERGFRILRMRNEQIYTFNFDELKKSSEQHYPTSYLSLFLK